MTSALASAAVAESRGMDLLRFATAGSVDDGKSTLIGRLLYDTKSLFTDQLEAVEAVSAARGDEYTNLALLTDGLRAEREQGITIDVAYRYFATPRRKFIIADTPGHIQYTRNMVTGASTADLALILVDARKGMLEQSRRHAFLCSLLRVPHLVLCVNKMDLVDWSQEVFEEIADEFTAFAAKLEAPDLTVIPVSALQRRQRRRRGRRRCPGTRARRCCTTWSTCTSRPTATSWTSGSRCSTSSVHSRASCADYRGYAGQVASGVLKPGDEVMVLPSGFTSRIASIDTADGPVAEAFPPMSVTVRLDDEIDISRGDMICRPNNAPAVAQDIEAMICWMDESQPLRGGRQVHGQAHDPHGARDRARRCTTGSTSTRCTATRRRPSCGSTRSAGCGCGRRRRCSPTSTGATARPAGSS